MDRQISFHNKSWNSICRDLLLIILFTLTLANNRPIRCPKTCVCIPLQQTSEALDVVCVSTNIPINIPAQTVKLTLIGLNDLLFPQGIFYKLPKLNILAIGNSNANQIYNGSFVGLDHVTHLILSNISLTVIEADAFRPLKEIVTLEFDNIPMKLLEIARSFSSIQNFTMRGLIIRCIGPDMRYAEILDDKFYASFRYVNLTNITITSCNLAIIRPGYATTFPNLMFINMSYNNLCGDKEAIPELLLLGKLVVIEFSYQYFSYRNTDQGRYGRRQIVKGNSVTRRFHVQDRSYCGGFFYPLPMPRNLQYIYLHHTRGNMNWIQLCFNSNNMLKFLDISSDYLFTVIHTVVGLRKLEYAYVQNVNLMHISLNAFDDMPAIRTILLGNNRLRHTIENDKNGSLFKSNKNLTSLDLSQNSINSIPNGFMDSIRGVRQLNLSRNYLTSVNITSLRHLQLLNLSDNGVTFLSEDFVNSVRTIRNIKLDLSNNPISTLKRCCEIFDFILLSKRKLFYKSEQYRCIFNELPVTFRKLSITDLERTCHDTFTAVKITMPFVLTLLLLVAISAMVVIYRKRWSIRTFLYVSKRYFRLRQERIACENFEYHAFVAYHESDSAWVRNLLRHIAEDVHGMRLCIHERDFIPGESIEDNIANAIEKSRRVILVISQAFTASPWCLLEMRLARQKAIEQCRDILVPVILKSIDYAKLNTGLLNIFRKKTYIKWPSDEDGRELFWKRLMQTLETIPLEEDI